MALRGSFAELQTSFLYREATQQPDLIKTQAGGVASVTVADCLACSGCVSSAEAVLIQQQSHAELLRALESKVCFLFFVDKAGQPHSANSLYRSIHVSS